MGLDLSLVPLILKVGDKVANKKITKVVCQGSCKKEKTINATNFFKSNREDYEIYGGFCPICKNCIKSIMLDDTGRVTPERFKAVLKYLDVVFVPKLYNEALVKCVEDNGKVLGEYRAMISLNKYNKLRYEDSSRFEYQSQLEEDKKIKQVSKELIEFWGVDIKDPREYEIYQKEFDKLCIQDGGEINGVKESYFKQIAILNYKAQQQLLANNLKEYDTTQKALTNICEKCGINPKQIQDSNDANRGTYGMFIKMIEEEEPIEDWNKLMGSFDMVKRILQVFFFGHLAQVAGFRNPLQCEYDETIKQYSVQVDTWEDMEKIEEVEEEKSRGKTLFARWKSKRGVERG